MCQHALFSVICLALAAAWGSERVGGPLGAERLVHNGVETFIARPKPEEVTLAGALVLFHGCSHQAEDWFRLPEEVLFVRAALARKLLVVAFTTPTHTRNFCWPSVGATGGQTLKTIRTALASVIAAETPPGALLPVLLAGGSSGGSFASLLPVDWGGIGSEVHVIGLAVFISPTAFVRRGELSSELLTLRAYPPVAFAYMPKDTSFASEANLRIVSTALKEQAAAPTRSWPVHPKPFTVDGLLTGLRYAQEEVPRLQAAKFVDSLKDLGLLDNDGLVLDDPRHYPWRRALKLLRHKVQGSGMGRDWLELSTEELLNCAWAQHEFSSEPGEEMLDWLLAVQSGSSPKASSERDATEL